MSHTAHFGNCCFSDFGADGSELLRLAPNGFLRGWRPFFWDDGEVFPGICEGGGGGGKLLMPT